MNISEAVNILGSFLGRRDIPELSRNSLKAEYGIEKADVMVMFGGSILQGGDELASAIKEGISRKYIIVGGYGHTTPYLRDRIEMEYPGLLSNEASESEFFSRYLEYRYGLRPDLIETRSTNCGNNITNLLELLAKENISFENIILMQDASMQLRMVATLRKYVQENARIISFACYMAKVAEIDGNLQFADNCIHGLWPMRHYLTLIAGEIPRLRDDADGYGPNGKDFIAHVDIPEEVEEAFSVLRNYDISLVREANPEYARMKE